MGCSPDARWWRIALRPQLLRAFGGFPRPGKSISSPRAASHGVQNLFSGRIKSARRKAPGDKARWHASGSAWAPPAVFRASRNTPGDPRRSERQADARCAARGRTASRAGRTRSQMHAVQLRLGCDGPCSPWQPGSPLQRRCRRPCLALPPQSKMPLAILTGVSGGIAKCPFRGLSRPSQSPCSLEVGERLPIRRSALPVAAPDGNLAHNIENPGSVPVRWVSCLERVLHFETTRC